MSKQNDTPQCGKCGSTTRVQVFNRTTPLPRCTECDAWQVTR